MNRTAVFRATVAGWVGGFAGNAVLGALFSSPWLERVLYDPRIQSQVFISLTPQRNIALSVMGLVVLSGIHGLLYLRIQPAIPGSSWVAKGLWWGLGIWAMYWLFQEWFIYVTLLGEPLALAAVELVVLLLGSIVEGLIIARLSDLKKENNPS